MVTETTKDPTLAATELELPEKLDLSSCEALAKHLAAMRGHPVNLLASNVTFVGAPGLQLLLSAQRQWDEDKTSFRFHQVSLALREGTSLLGYPSFPFHEANVE